MWTDNIYGKASQCPPLPPLLHTPSGTTNGTNHIGPIHLWPPLLSQVGPLYGRERSVLRHQSEEVPASFAFWPPGLVSFPPSSLPSLPCAFSSFLPSLSPQFLFRPAGRNTRRW